MPDKARESRPDPDALLAQVQAEEARRRKGKLKIFFGAAAGVGKTSAMLSAARVKAIEGMDVVVGYAEPHARRETEELLLGLDILPSRKMEYRGTTLKEFDLDSALRRSPDLILVDELAHTNAPGSRHAKRWQDVQELLDAGIDVYTTLNVQHLESLNDVVAQITGVIVRETLPDAVFEHADDVELVDLPPDELLERMAEGKVYIPHQAERAVQNFFRRENLTVLRELALRKVTERVTAEVQDARAQRATPRTWPTTERLLVYITAGSSAPRVIRAAKRMATALRADWTVAHVQTPRLREAAQSQHDQLHRHFRLAERLGANTVVLDGLKPADELIGYARQRNVTKIIVGKSDRPWWHDPLRRSPVDQLLRKSGDIDVYVIRGIAPDRDDRDDARSIARHAPHAIDWPICRDTVVILLLCTAVAWALWYLFDLGDRGDLSNLVMIYLVGVVAVAARHGRTASVVAAVLSVAFFDFAFVPPRFTFAVHDTQYLVTFLVMLCVALVIGTLTVRIRSQAETSRQREWRIEALYRMTDQLAAQTGVAEVADTALRHLLDVFACPAAIFLPEQDRLLLTRATPGMESAREESERAVAQWAYQHQQPAGHGTDTLPASSALYLPLATAKGAIGVIGFTDSRTASLLSPQTRLTLDAFLRQIALAIERVQLAQQARAARIQAEAEKLRSSLLSSVSHDLRTPLAVITGASSSLLQSPHPDTGTRHELIQTIHDESRRLTRLVGNLLDITRLESGGLSLARQWQPLEEIVGSALRQVEPLLSDHPLATSLPPDLPMVLVDGMLIEQLLVNLLENAAKYTPAGAPIQLRASAQTEPDSTPALPRRHLLIEVIDHGPGLPKGDETRIFEKFYRGANARPHSGAGLGLPICRAIAQVHGGRMWAENRLAPDGSIQGAAFRVTIPIEGQPPTVQPEPAA